MSIAQLMELFRPKLYPKLHLNNLKNNQLNRIESYKDSHPLNTSQTHKFCLFFCLFDPPLWIFRSRVLVGVQSSRLQPFHPWMEQTALPPPPTVIDRQKKGQRGLGELKRRPPFFYSESHRRKRIAHPLPSLKEPPFQ